MEPNTTGASPVLAPRRGRPRGQPYDGRVWRGRGADRRTPSLPRCGDLGIGAWQNDVPTLTFSGASAPSQSGPLVVGQLMRVRYDLSRLPCCRGPSGGGSTLMATVSTSATRHEFGDYSSSGPIVELYAVVPAEREIQLSFRTSDVTSCSEEDSREGLNYRFETRGLPDAMLRLSGSYANTLEGTLRAGGTLTVDYAVGRADCTAAYVYGTLTSGELTMFYRFDGGEVRQVSLLSTMAGAPDRGVRGARFLTPPRVQVPAGVERLEVWFLGFRARGGATSAALSGTLTSAGASPTP